MAEEVSEQAVSMMAMRSSNKQEKPPIFDWEADLYKNDYYRGPLAAISGVLAAAFLTILAGA